MRRGASWDWERVKVKVNGFFHERRSLPPRGKSIAQAKLPVNNAQLRIHSETQRWLQMAAHNTHRSRGSGVDSRELVTEK